MSTNAQRTGRRRAPSMPDFELGPDPEMVKPKGGDGGGGDGGSDPEGCLQAAAGCWVLSSQVGVWIAWALEFALLLLILWRVW